MRTAAARAGMEESGSLEQKSRRSDGWIRLLYPLPLKYGTRCASELPYAANPNAMSNLCVSWICSVGVVRVIALAFSRSVKVAYYASYPDPTAEDLTAKIGWAQLSLLLASCLPSNWQMGARRREFVQKGEAGSFW